MNLLDKKQYQAILINSIGDKARFKFLVEKNTFKSYTGKPVGKAVKLRATLDVLETFLSVVKQGEVEFTEEAKSICEKVLNTYQDYKYELLEGRETEPHPIADKKEININSFEEFVDLLLDRCLTYQSIDYPRMKVALYSLVSIKMFEKRRDYSVLVFDEEMLLFLVAMMVKEDRIRMEELYKRFHEYGIDFSFQTKNAISDYLLKLNLLERKSDSGEAQYVRVVF